MDSELAKWFIIILAALSFITTLYQYLRSRRKKMPLSAQNDVKARRLWQCDPQAYQRKFGDIDRKLEDNLRERSES
ncbi:MAG: hypothetical protein OQK12_00635 [Motiliproteus sp.]|nr:hypothetical protein [Motiliproteus sp.]MCW9053426.1 hypothetical protein [Motiliproteus sp.]